MPGEAGEAQFPGEPEPRVPKIKASLTALRVHIEWEGSLCQKVPEGGNPAERASESPGRGTLGIRRGLEYSTHLHFQRVELASGRGAGRAERDGGGHSASLGPGPASGRLLLTAPPLHASQGCSGLWGSRVHSEVNREGMWGLQDPKSKKAPSQGLALRDLDLIGPARQHRHLECSKKQRLELKRLDNLLFFFKTLAGQK